MDMKDLTIARDHAVRSAAQYPQRVQGFMEHLFLYERMTGQAPEDWAHRNYYGVVIDLAPPPRYGALILPEGYDEMERGQCFHNAWKLVCEDPSLIYCEGYAQAGFFPMEHAWVETPDGEIVDPTWTGLEGRYEEALYYGVRFTPEFTLRNSLRTGWTSILQGDNTDKGANHILRYGLQTNDDGIVTDYKEHP